jgi:DNA topoisomerase IB/ADP-ribose pyrophosphatase YjhB (NUDIX family)
VNLAHLSTISTNATSGLLSKTQGALARAIEAYSDDEDRDSSGKWTSGDDRRAQSVLKPQVEYEQVVKNYMEDIRQGKDVGAVLVSDKDHSHIVDGNHKTEAYLRLGKQPPRVYAVDRLKTLIQMGQENKTADEVADSIGEWLKSEDIKAYSEDEERDDHGKWSSGGSLKPAEEDRTQWPQHIQDLKVPPAWKDVHYSDDPKAALLATGKDAKGRDQRVYSKEFQDSQAGLKFERVEELGKQMGLIDQQLIADRKSDDDKTKEHADAALLVRTMGVRPGSETDTKAKVQAYGATTLEGRHVRVSTTGNVRLNFTGKKGVGINLPVEDKQVAAMLVSRKADAGNSGQIFPHVSNSSLLDYVHDNLDHGGFKSKDFRTYLGTSTAQGLVSSMKEPATPKDYVKAVRSVASAVAEKLGNTPAVALSSYIAPQVFSGWKMHAGVTAEAMELPQVYYGEVSDNQRDFRDVAGLFDSSDTDDGDDSDGSVEKMLGFDPAKMGIAASVLRRSTARERTQKKALFVKRECATLLAEFDEEQHPRDEHGKFTDGGGETTTDRTSWHFDDFHPEDKINGIPLAHMSHPDFEKYTNPDLKETPLKVGPGQHAAAGVIMIEPGNKVWIVTPDKYFGGYRNTFPKGTQESGEALQTTAVRETYEESGLVGKITGVLGDVDRTTSSTRYYIGERVGGSPAMAGEETYAVKLLDLNDPKTDERLQDVMGKTTKDADVLSMIREHLGIEQPAQPEAPATGKMTAADIMDKKIGGSQGSNVGGFYKGTDGVDRYVKLYNNPEQAHGEVLANTIYRDLNIPAPQSQVFSLPNGKEAFASDIVHGGKTLEQTGVTKENAREVLKGFAADVLTANWDTVGLTYDNILLKGGQAYRLDNGSAFLYRAQGGQKPDALLNKVTELKGFLSPTVNREYAKMAKVAGYTSADEIPGFRSQVKAIAALEKVAGGWGKYLDAKAPYLSANERSKIGDMLTSRTAGLKEAAGVSDSLHDKIKNLFSEAEDSVRREVVACSR